MFFANYSTGYKSGGYNSGGGSPALSTFDPTGNLISTQRVFDQETVNNYELGARTNWLDRALTANLTLYRMDIAGYQDRAFDGTSFTIRNAGNLRQQGFELDLIVEPVRQPDRSPARSPISTPRSPIIRTPPGLPGLGGTQDLRGKPVTFSPEFSGRARRRLDQ